MPGAVTPDGKLAVNPAVGAPNPPDGVIRTPSLVVTDIKAAQPKVPSCTTATVHRACKLMAAGFTRCARPQYATSHLACPDTTLAVAQHWFCCNEKGERMMLRRAGGCTGAGADATRAV